MQPATTLMKVEVGGDGTSVRFPPDLGPGARRQALREAEKRAALGPPSTVDPSRQLLRWTSRRMRKAASRALLRRKTAAARDAFRNTR
jgi:hypothetical protein